MCSRPNCRALPLPTASPLRSSLIQWARLSELHMQMGAAQRAPGGRTGQEALVSLDKELAESQMPQARHRCLPLYPDPYPYPYHYPYPEPLAYIYDVLRRSCCSPR